MFEVPTSLSPSRVESFLSCPMAFRFASIEQLPEPPAEHSTKGSLVHRALELLFTEPSHGRDLAAARVAFDRAVVEFRADPEFTGLRLDETKEAAFLADAWVLVERYFEMEDPRTVRDIGIELRLSATVGDLELRGIIDRLELDDEGRLVVVDYKTGRVPGPKYEQDRMNGVHFYSFLCQEVLGERPVEVRLMYLRGGRTITATPTAQSVRFLTTRTTAVWKAIAAACTSGDFQPKQGPLCNLCAFRDWCPAFGGSPERARHEAPARYAALTA